MARLIDGDRLYDCVETRYRQSSGEEHKAERELLDVICDMPTIDAIPVEWLKRQHLQYMQCNDKLMCDAYAVVLGEWIGRQKEQEVI